MTTSAMLRRFFGYYAPYKGLFMLDFGSAVLSGVLELAFPLAVALFIDRLLPSGEWPLILTAAAALLVIYIVNTGLQAVVNYWGHALGVGIETDMRRKAFDHLHKLSFRFFDNNKTGTLITHVTKDLEEVGEVAHHGPEDLFVAVMTFAGAFVLMLTINWQLTLVTAAIVPVMVWAVSKYGSQMTLTWQRLFEGVGRFNVRIEESIGGVRVVKAFANEDHERQLFERDNQSYRTTKLRAYWVMTASIMLSYFSTRFTQVVVMLAGTWFVVAGELSYGGFVGFLLLIDVFMRPIDQITGVLESYPKGIAGFRRYSALIDTIPDIADRPGAVVAGPLRGDIVYKDVSFGYSDHSRVVTGLNLTIRAGETVAFVGPSGAGKSTICSLLPRFYEIDAGTISVDGTDIRDFTQASLRARIGIVQQDVFLFGGTIRDNIAYGRLGATDPEILQAARRARLDDVLAGLPAGLDTLVGERGVKLSGGQKQRVAIARIFLKDPPILILDEATSALDTETERGIQASLAELGEGRTTLVIAHRLATIRHADHIVVVTDAGIAEQGTHAELLSAGRVYFRLARDQVGVAELPI